MNTIKCGDYLNSNNGIYINGEILIEVICNNLKIKNRLLTDSNIINELRELTYSDFTKILRSME
jgi:hypothetical protein